ncbi:hypothetical protein WA158_002902 [Blastocystis sp. Blastoise]
MFLMETQAVTLIKSELNLDRDEWYYYTNIKTGSQESPAKMMIDTTYGSSYVYARKCVGCYHVSTNPYDKSNSTTASPISCGDSLCKPVSCHRYDCHGTCHASTRACCSKSDNSLCAYSITFMDDTIIDGSLVRDNIMIQTTTGYSQSFPTTFGYIEDGRLGLGYRHSACAPSCINSYMDDMVDNISGVRDMFTICFGNTKGVLSYGGIDEDLYSGNITWVDFDATGYYTVELSDFRVNNTHFFNSTKIMFTDITTLGYVMFLQTDLYDAFATYLKTYYSHLPRITGQYSIFNDYCLNDPPSSSWPSVDVYLNGVHLILSKDLYFYPVFHENEYYYCFSIVREKRGYDYSTLGASFMRGYTLIYDRGRDRIGIATPTNACHTDVTGGIETLDPPPTPAPTPDPTTTPTTDPTTTPTTAPTPTPSIPNDDSTDTLVIIMICCSLAVVVICSVIIIVSCRYYNNNQKLPNEESKANKQLLNQTRKSSKSQELASIHKNIAF